MHILIFLIFFMFSQAIADEWITIVPLPHCAEFKVQYQFNGRYHIRYQEKLYSDFKIFPKTLENINDLSSLTDELVEASYNYCPMSINLTEIDGELVCARDELSSKPFGNDYTKLLQDMISAIDKKGDNCKDVIPLINLQNELAQLDQNKLLSFDKTFNLVKLVTGKKTNKLIDHYYECGAEKGSQQLIENLILIEGKKACLYPAPPGILDFEKAKEIAREVAKRYPGKGLLELNSEKNNIIKDTVTGFVNAALNQQVNAIFGNEFDSKSFVDNLDVSKKIKNMDADKVQEYTTYGLSVDAPLEIIDKGLPILIEKNFSKMLPQNMSKEEKASYLKNDISNLIKKDYESCIKDFKVRVDFPSKKSTKKLIKYRKNLEKDFCKTNPIECNKQGCGKTKNFGTLRKDIKDKNIIQACLFKGITLAIKPILKKIVLAQRDEFKDKFTMSEKTAHKISDHAYKNIHHCADKKIKKIAGKNYKSKFTINVEALYHVDTKEYTKAVLECSKQTELDLTKLFAKMMITNMEVVNKTFKDKKSVILFDQIYNKGAYDFADRVASNALNKCLTAQRERVGLTKTSAISCRPIIEMEAGKELIDKALESTMVGANVDILKTKTILKDFNGCADRAISFGTHSMFNKNSEYPIMNPEQGEDYLNKNHDFYECIQDSIVKVSEEVTDQSLDDMEIKLNSKEPKLKDPEYFKSLKPKLKSMVSRCFNSKMGEIKSWREFQDFNKSKGLENLKTKCTLIANNYALPKIIINETEQQLSPVAESKISDISVSKIALMLKDKYKIKISPKTRDGNEKIILEAFRKFQKLNPGQDIEQFIKSYSKDAQLETINSIRDSILETVITNSRPGFDFTDLGEALPAGCMNTIYTDQKENLNKLIKMIKDAPKEEGVPKKNLKLLFSDMLKKGLIWSKQQGRYYEYVEKVKDLCKNPQDYRDVQSFAKIGIADDMLMSVIEVKVKESLINAAVQQCYDELEKQNITLPIQTQTMFCSEKPMTNLELKAFKKALFSGSKSPEEKSILDFTLNRKFQFMYQIHNDLRRSDLEKMFYKDRTTLDYIYANFDKIVSKDEGTINKMTEISAEKLFEDRSPTSFASKFAENQIVSAIGITGIPQGKESIKAKVENLGYIKGLFKDTIKPEAKKEFFNRWNHSGVSHYLDWKNLPQEKREIIISELLRTNIHPRLDKSLTEEERDLKKLPMVAMVKDHVKNYKHFKNPKYNSKAIGRAKASQKMKGVEEKLSFTEMIAHDINTGVKDKVIDSVFDSLNPFK
jgi:hypothetical protein